MWTGDDAIGDSRRMRWNFLTMRKSTLLLWLACTANNRTFCSCLQAYSVREFPPTITDFEVCVATSSVFRVQPRHWTMIVTTPHRFRLRPVSRKWTLILRLLLTQWETGLEALLVRQFLQLCGTLSWRLLQHCFSHILWYREPRIPQFLSRNSGGSSAAPTCSRFLDNPSI